MIISRIYEHQNLLSLQLVSFLIGLRTYQRPCNVHCIQTHSHPCTVLNVSAEIEVRHFIVYMCYALRVQSSSLCLCCFFILLVCCKNIVSDGMCAAMDNGLRGAKVGRCKVIRSHGHKIIFNICVHIHTHTHTTRFLKAQAVTGTQRNGCKKV